MIIELNGQWGTEIHKMSNEQFKKFKEWYDDKHSIKVFTYYRDGYAWSINKSQSKLVKFWEE